MTYILDGKKLAQDKELLLIKKIDLLRLKGISPKLVSILVGDSQQSETYLNLKRNRAKGCGIEFELIKFDENEKVEKIIETILNLNSDRNVHGVMIQLPLPVNIPDADKRKLINSISAGKDVDGMREETKFTTPVVLAVETAFSMSEEYIKHNNYPYNLVVLGSKGFVGSKLIKKFESYNSRLYKIKGLDIGDDNFDSILKNADIIISVTGVMGLIKKSMIKNGSVLIDVGSPIGDINKDCYSKAVFVSPVPGGIGPLTIYYLMENVYFATLL